MAILIIVKDLALREKIRGGRVTEATNLIFARSLDQASERVQACTATNATAEQQPTLITTTIVDLNSFDASPQELVDQLRALTPEAKLVGFCSHVDTERISAAKAAGFASVLPRSRFFATLPEILGS